MKKILFAIVTTCMLASCGAFGGGDSEQLKAENESLKTELIDRNAELEEMMATFNEISEGFRQINEAENRVDFQRGAVGEGSLTAREQITADIEFIRKQMQTNREQIAKLQTQLKNSKNQSSQLKKAIENLTAELNLKTQRIEDLQNELAAKNIRIQELDAAVTELTGKNDALIAENQAKQQTVAQQDKALNSAWFVFGTKKELKEQNILTDTGLFKKGKVMQDANANLEYFTKIDIRTTTEIPLYSKSVDVLTTHPESSYTLEEDAKEQKVLKITNPAEFWSISKYLVIQVK